MKIPNEKYAVRAFYSEFAAEGNSLTFKKMLKGEPFTPEYNQVNTLAGLGSFLFWMAKKLYLSTAPRLGFLLEGSNKK